MKPSILYLLGVIFLFSTTACNLKTDEKINAEQVNNTIKKKKIKRVLDDDIVGFAYEKGEEAGNKILAQLLNPEHDLCAVASLDQYINDLKIDWIASVTVRCEPRFFTHPKEKEMWEAYQKAFEDDIEAPAGVQRLGNKQSYQQLVYTVPIRYVKEDTKKWAMLSIVMNKSDLIVLF